LSDEFKNQMCILRDMARKKIIPVHVVTRNLKSELIPKEKDPREFMGDEPSYVAWTKAVLGDYISHVKAHSLVSACKIGINPHGAHWHLLHEFIFRKGEKVNFFGGDISGCDVSVPPWVGYAMAIHINQWYGYVEDSEDYNELLCCCMSIFQNFRIKGSGVYYVGRGHPSGHWLTGYVNSFLMYIVHKLAFFYCLPYSNLR
jgi:hypothetical protein